MQEGLGEALLVDEFAILICPGHALSSRISADDMLPLLLIKSGKGQTNDVARTGIGAVQLETGTAATANVVTRLAAIGFRRTVPHPCPAGCPGRPLTHIEIVIPSVGSKAAVRGTTT